MIHSRDRRLTRRDSRHFRRRLQRTRATVKATAGALLLAAVSCAPGPAGDSTAGSWVGTITTEGNVTTVVNASGSVWDGTARLAEELSIGVETGADAYMLGEVLGIACTDDRIFVLDGQVPVVRAYDWSGQWIRDLGREGQGPGEFRFPTGLGVDGEGRVWVHESPFARLMVFSPGGEPLATFAVEASRGGSSSLVVSADGRGFLRDFVRPDPDSATEEIRIVMRPYDAAGAVGESIDVSRFDDAANLEAWSGDWVRMTAVPFHPVGATALASTGTLFSGYPDRYRFEARHDDGNTTVIEREFEPPAVLVAEADDHRRAATRYLQGMDSGWTWSGPDVPTTKPAFSQFVPAVDGAVWVVRAGDGTRLANCDDKELEPSEDAPCWDEERIVDVFGADGRYLGEVEVPENISMQPRPFIRDDVVIARVEDDTGLVSVKRYRLVLPGEEPR
jgi:hypothetical protein